MTYETPPPAPESDHRADAIPLQQERIRYREKFLSATRSTVPPDIASAIDNVATDLQMALYKYMSRPGSDPEIVTLVDKFVDNVSRQCRFGSGDESLSPPGNRDLKSLLVGSVMASDFLRDSGKVEVQPVKHAPYAWRFLELVRDRVGSFDASAGGAATLHIKLSADQSSNTVKDYRGPKEVNWS